MFRHTQRRLLFSYILVLAAVLGTFTFAVRVFVVNSWKYELIAQLTALAEGAAASTDETDFQEIKELPVASPQDSATPNDSANKAENDDDESTTKDLIARGQALQWWTSDRRLVGQLGSLQLSLDLLPKRTLQLQPGNPRIQALTIPIFSSTTHKVIGYVRAIQSLAESDAANQRLDAGLVCGVLLALMVSGVGGILLTKQSMQPVEASFQRLQQFTADASHEFRGPLMAIKSNVSVALRHPDGMRAGDLEKMQAIASATNQMTALTDDLLILARSDETTAEYRWKTVDLVTLLSQLGQTYATQALLKKIELTMHLPEALTVQGDAAQLLRLYGNLVENALNYTPAAGTIQITALADLNSAVVAITDSGIGIAADQLPYLFDRFWRADRARSYWDGGSGLGLTIAQRLAQIHHGRITVKSTVQVGSCFTVYLPLSLPESGVIILRKKTVGIKLRQCLRVLWRYLQL